jgi:23S rRNA (cytosine1962-C5)-methyltransferase
MRCWSTGIPRSGLARGFDWVYPNEIVARTGSTQSGDAVDIISKDGRHLGVGVCSDGKVAIRRFRTTPGPLDAAFVAKALERALHRRRCDERTTAWRWVHGENDDMPGVRVDVWGSHICIAIDHSSLQFMVPWIVEALCVLRDVDTIWQNRRPEHNDERSSPEEGECLYGDHTPRDVVVLEHGLQYLVRPEMGLDAGLYPDMRDIRAWLRPYWDGRRVLNTFAYTGAFSVAAAANGAARVDTVDLAAMAIKRSQGNFEANQLAVEPHGFWVEDTFSALDRFRRAGEFFDMIIVDPPSFARGPKGIWSIEKELSRVVAGCLRVLAPGGWIMVATNQGSMSPREFQKHIQTAALKVGRRLRLIHQGSTPHDVPAALGFPESRYLKAWVLEG